MRQALSRSQRALWRALADEAESKAVEAETSSAWEEAECQWKQALEVWERLDLAAHATHARERSLAAYRRRIQTTIMPTCNRPPGLDFDRLAYGPSRFRSQKRRTTCD